MPKSSEKQAYQPAFFMSFYLDKPLLLPFLSASFITIFILELIYQSRRKLLISLKKIEK
jgi:hypothetical protein